MCQKYSNTFWYTDDICIYIIMGHIWHIWYCWYIYNCTHTHTVVVDLWIVQAEPALLEPGQNDADHEWVSCFAIGTWCLIKCHKMLQEFLWAQNFETYTPKIYPPKISEQNSAPRWWGCCAQNLGIPDAGILDDSFDVRWSAFLQVRDHVLFRRPTASPPKEAVGDAQSQGSCCAWVPSECFQKGGSLIMGGLSCDWLAKLIRSLVPTLVGYQMHCRSIAGPNWIDW